MENALTQSTLVVDGHVHIYPQYPWADAVKALIRNLTAAIRTTESPPHVIPLGLLTESKATRFYQNMMETGIPLTEGSLQVEAGPDTDSLIIREDGTVKGYLIAGRQIVTLEKLEVLALGKDLSIFNGLPLTDTLQAITAQGAVPVLSWSPGKWFFGRGKLVQSLINTHTPGSFLLGDIGLRPTLWPLPRLMKMAGQRGFKTICGSDSLPFPGEECWIGRTGFEITGNFNALKPATSLRAILTNPSSTFIPIGQRSSLIAFAHRWGRNQMK